MLVNTMVISRAESVPLPGRQMPVLPGDLDVTGWGAIMVARELPAARQQGAGASAGSALGIATSMIWNVF